MGTRVRFRMPVTDVADDADVSRRHIGLDFEAESLYVAGNARIRRAPVLEQGQTREGHFQLGPVPLSFNGLSQPSVFNYLWRLME